MKISCPACNAHYRVPDERVQGKNRVFRIRCKRCGGDIRVRGVATDGDVGRTTMPFNLEVPSTAPAAPSRVWFAGIDGKQVGPLTEQELIDHIEAGRLGAADLVWRKGFAAWTATRDVEPFGELVGERKAATHDEPAEKKRPRRRAQTLELSAQMIELLVKLDEQSGSAGDGEPPPATIEPPELPPLAAQAAVAAASAPATTTEADEPPAFASLDDLDDAEGAVGADEAPPPVPFEAEAEAAIAGDIQDLDKAAEISKTEVAAVPVSTVAEPASDRELPPAVPKATGGGAASAPGGATGTSKLTKKARDKDKRRSGATAEATPAHSPREEATAAQASRSSSVKVRLPGQADSGASKAGAATVQETRKSAAALTTRGAAAGGPAARLAAGKQERKKEKGGGFGWAAIAVVLIGVVIGAVVLTQRKAEPRSQGNHDKEGTSVAVAQAGAVTAPTNLGEASSAAPAAVTAEVDAGATEGDAATGANVAADAGETAVDDAANASADAGAPPPDAGAEAKSSEEQAAEAKAADANAAEAKAAEAKAAEEEATAAKAADKQPTSARADVRKPAPRAAPTGRATSTATPRVAAQPASGSGGGDEIDRLLNKARRDRAAAKTDAAAESKAAAQQAAAADRAAAVERKAEAEQEARASAAAAAASDDDTDEIDRLLNKAKAGRAARAEPEGASTGSSAKPAKLTQAEVNRVAAGANSAALRCYMLHADADGGTETIKVLLYVNSDGSVKTARVVGQFSSSPVAGCVVDAVRKLRFPQSSGAATKYTIKYSVGG